MRLYVNASELRRLSASTADDAQALGVVVAKLDPAVIGHHRLADAVDAFEATAETGVAQLSKAAQALSDWMLLAAEVAEADDAALAAEYRAQGHVAIPTRNRGAEAADGGGP